MIGIVTQNTDPGNAELNCMFLTMKIGLLSLWISKHVRQIKKKTPCGRSRGWLQLAGKMLMLRLVGEGEQGALRTCWLEKKYWHTESN